MGMQSKAGTGPLGVGKNMPVSSQPATPHLVVVERCLAKTVSLDVSIIKLTTELHKQGLKLPKAP